MFDPLALCPDCTPSQAQQLFEKTIYGVKIVVSSNEFSFIRWLGYHLSQDVVTAPSGPLGDDVKHTVRYHVHIGDGVGGDAAGHRIIGQDDPIVECRSWGHLQAHMERAITRAVRRYVAPYHVVHAGAMARNGRAMLLPGNSGAGKSTLVAALAFSGFEYYTDEVTVLTPEGHLLPYPKAITLKLGGWEALSDLYPQVASVAYAPVHHDRLRHLVAPKLPPPSVMGTGSRIDFFVFPRYAPGEATALVPVSRATALARLAERSLNLFLLRKEGLDLLYGLVRRVECYELMVGDLSEAVWVLEALLTEGQPVSPHDTNGTRPLASGVPSARRPEAAISGRSLAPRW